MAKPQTVEHFVARHIAEHDRIALAAGSGDGVDIGLHREIFLIMCGQQVSDQLAHPAKANDDGLLRFHRQFIGGCATAAAHFHTPRDVMTEAGQ